MDLSTDFSMFEIAGVSLVVLIPGIVEFCKSAFGLQDGAAEALAVAVGAVFFALAEAMNQMLIPEAWLPFIYVVVVALAGSLSVPGYYKLVKQAGGAILAAISAK